MDPEKMKAARLQLGLTQQELGDTMGVTASQISKWESGKIKMSRRYHIQFKDLFSNMILGAQGYADYMELGQPVPTWVEDPSLDPENYEFDAEELTKTEQLLERKEFVSRHRDDPPSEEELPESIEYLMSPTLEKDGFEIVGSSSGGEKGKFVTIKDKKGKQLNLPEKRFIQWRSEGINPFDKKISIKWS